MQSHQPAGGNRIFKRTAWLRKKLHAYERARSNVTHVSESDLEKDDSAYGHEPATRWLTAVYVPH